ncbi:MAG: response regulator [Pseudanabaena sp.]
MSDTVNVLIIEDSEDDAILIVRSLRQSGFVLTWERVQTVEELHQALTNRTWDVIISDYNLPKMNAPMALEIVKQSQLDLPFIVVSGTIGETLAVDLMRAGANDYLMKGSLARLAEAVRREIREFKMRQERQQASLELELTKQRLQLALEGSAIGPWDWVISTGELTINERWAEILGYTSLELEPITFETWHDHTHTDDVKRTLKLLKKHFHREIPAYEDELRMRHKLGHWVWILCRGKVTEWDAQGKPQRMTGTHLDISDRKQAELRLSLQSSILERIAKAESLPKILEALVSNIEEQLDGAICSILLCDEGKLYCGAMPNLPEAYNQVIDKMSIGEGAGCCGTAAFRRERVIVADIANDPLWKDLKETALAHNIRACWSTPVIATDGNVIATFAVYYPYIHYPIPQEIEITNLATDIAKIAIERDQAAQALANLNHNLEMRVAQRTDALRQSEAKLIEAQQIARLGSWELDVQTKEIIWSREIFNIFGMDANQQEPTYEQMLQYFPPEERIRFNNLIERAIQLSEPYATDFQIIRADGSLGYIFAKAELLYDVAGHSTRLFGIAMDISDRKAMQEALKLSEERARATLLALPDLVFRVNRSGEYIDFLASPNVGNIIDPRQVIGKSLADCLPPETWAKEYHAMQKALNTNTLQTYEQQIQIDGHMRYEEVRVAPCVNDEVVFFIRDISDRKQAEAQLQKTNEELMRATRLKDEFLANMSHELRTPLNAILGMAEAMQEEVFGEVNEDQINALNTIERSGTHLLALINDILDVAKIESGQLKLEYALTSVDTLCHSSIALIRQLAHQKRIKLKVNIPDNLPQLMLDERRIRQVLINLLNNAVKFTPEGGQIGLEVTSQIFFKGHPLTDAIPESILIHPDDPQLPKLSLDKINQCFNYLQIAITDTGIGISPENIRRLFKPFVQIDSSLNRQYMGTGLGLAIVKQITELHGGMVRVTSKIGHGSCFMIALPFQDSRDRTIVDSKTETSQNLHLEEVETNRASSFNSPLILLAEDNKANIGTISCYLEAKGYHLILAYNGQEVVNITKSHNPDVILMDIQLPIVDGITAIRQIRSDRAFDHIPIIALTALVMAGDREKCLAAGANEYLAKPVRLKQLVDMIKRLLSS